LNKRPLKLLQFTPVYNLCPTQDSPVLRLVEGERQFDPMRWQLVPNWEPTFSTKLTTINAKNGFRQSPFSGIRIWPAVHRSIERYAAFGIPLNRVNAARLPQSKRSGPRLPGEQSRFSIPP